MASSRDKFSSRLGFVLAAAGSAVGIGNLVGFPVAATKGGGGAFLLLYTLFVIFVCIPIMVAELSLGRATQKDPVGAYISEAGEKSSWRFAGLLATVTPFMIAVFYMVITVWVLGYLVGIVTGDLDVLANPQTFSQFINEKSVFIYLAVVALLVNVILLRGVKDGIEAAAKVLMPALFILLLGLVVFVLTLDNAIIGVKYYLIPDLNKINAGVVNSALSQAFFSLSLGMGILITYGSYVGDAERIDSNAKFVAGVDTLVAFSAGLMILPAIFALNPQASPEELSDSSVGMIFTYLPQIFLALETSIGYIGASIVATIFFLLVFFAALTSLVSIVEVPAASLIDTLGLKRKGALLRLTTLMTLLAIACVVSFGTVQWLTEFVYYAGQHKSFFDVVVDVFYDTVLPLNGLLICLFVRYRWKKRMNAELSKGDERYPSSLTQKYVDFSLNTFIPVILLVIFVNTLAFKFFGMALFG